MFGSYPFPGTDTRFLTGPGSQVLPVFGGEVVERQQFVTVFLQAVAGFVVLRAVGFQEDVIGFDRLSTSGKTKGGKQRGRSSLIHTAMNKSCVPFVSPVEGEDVAWGCRGDEVADVRSGEATGDAADGLSRADVVGRAEGAVDVAVAEDAVTV